MYHIMDSNLVFSKHETRESAEATIAQAVKQGQDEAKRLREEADEAEAYAANLIIVSGE